MWLPEPTNMSSYYDASVSSRPKYPSLKKNEVCDLCIVGGGITGVSAAYHAAKQGLKVILLERDVIAWAASGRNAGFMTPYVDYDPDSLVKEIGQAAAEKYWEIAHESVSHLDELVAANGIECDLKHGLLMAAPNQKSLDKLGVGLESFTKKYGLKNARLLNRNEAVDIVNTDEYVGGLYHEDIATLHPLKYVLGLAQAANNLGAIFRENSCVTGFVEDQSGVTVKVIGGHVVRCNSLLLATNAYMGELAPALSKRFLSMHANIIATEPLSEELKKEIFPQDVAILEAQAATTKFYRLSADNRLIFGGGGIFTGRNGYHVQPILRKMMIELFPQLKKTQVDHVWGGWFGMTVYSDTPDVGRVSERIHYAQAIPVVWATLHGKLLAESLAGKSDRYDVLANIDIPPGPGGEFLGKLLWKIGDVVSATRSLLIA